jgi:hypothetical protein
VGPIGAALAQPLVARVLAADGVPVAGVEVVFAVATGGGSLSVQADTSDANGDVSTVWTLGTVIGAQSVSATATGLAGSPLTFTATADPSDPAQLSILAQPIAGTAGTSLAPALLVAVQDIEGNTVTGYTGAVTVAFAEPQDAVLGGTTTVNAVAGLATFADLTIDLAGSLHAGRVERHAPRARGGTDCHRRRGGGGARHPGAAHRWRGGRGAPHVQRGGTRPVRQRRDRIRGCRDHHGGARGLAGECDRRG